MRVEIHSVMTRGVTRIVARVVLDSIRLVSVSIRLVSVSIRVVFVRIRVSRGFSIGFSVQNFSGEISVKIDYKIIFEFIWWPLELRIIRV